jgi:hypothetical protein
MAKAFLISVVLLAASSFAQDGLTIKGGVNDSVSNDAQKIYASACTIIRRQVGATHQPNPRILLVLGAEKDEALWQKREIRLKKWNPFLFAQGTVLFAFDDVIAGQKLEMAKRAVAWSQATIDIAQGR